MDLNKLLEGVENKEELIKNIQAELGKAYVPRAEFNKKNDELKNLETELTASKANLDSLTKDKEAHEQTVADLTNQVKSYETSALKSRIARETGIPFELAGRLSGEDEKALREDAESLSKLIGKSQHTPPLKSNEPAGGDDKDSALKSMLSDLKGE